MITLMTLIGLVGSVFVGLGLFFNFTADNTYQKSLAVIPFVIGVGFFLIDAVLYLLRLVF